MKASYNFCVYASLILWLTGSAQADSGLVKKSPAAGADENISQGVSSLKKSATYGRLGTMEVGADLTLAAVSEGMLLQVGPSVGCFFADNFRIAARLGLQARNFGYGSFAEFTSMTIVVEPSFHLPIIWNLYAFAGLGSGVVVDRATGFVVAPRLGLDILVGESGVLTTAATMSYRSNSDVRVSTRDGSISLASTAWGANLGYAWMW